MIRRLKAWLKKSGNSYGKLAKLMGHKSRSTSYNWLKRNKIPKHAVAQLKEIFDVSASEKKTSKA